MRGIKKTILLIFLAISNFVYSQSILGVRFGSSYEDAKKTLEDRFGRYIEEDKGNLTIYDFDMGTFHFNSGTLCFQWKERGSKFFRAEFQKWSGTRNVESMKAEREYLKRLFPSDHPDTVTCKSINSKYVPFEVRLKDVYGVYRVLMCMSLK